MIETNQFREFKIGYISDTHIDFYIKNGKQGNALKKSITSYIDNYMKPEKMDILILAGDESHYNSQTVELILQMKQYADHIFVIAGNHEMYLINESQRTKYNKCSSNRINELKEFCEDTPDVYYLDGQVISIYGLRIGGTMNWYDLPTSGLIAQWNEVMNDSNLIQEGISPTRISYGYGGTFKESHWPTQEFRERELKNLKNIAKEKCHIFATHVCPIIIPDEFTSPYYINDRNNVFYMSDNMKEIKESGAEMVIFGHQHDKKQFEIDGIEFKINANGYPNERRDEKKIEYFNYMLEI